MHQKKQRNLQRKKKSTADDIEETDSELSEKANSSKEVKSTTLSEEDE